MPRLFIFILTIALLPGLAVGADSADREEIVVIATRSPLPADETGASVTVIDAADLETRQYGFLADALADAAGLSISRNGAYGGQTALRIRGESAGRTLVMIDGVIVNDPASPSGGFDFASLGVVDIERIEIIRGPQSIVYGSEAIGGVVSIQTKRGGESPGVRLMIEGGSFATLRAGAGATASLGGVDVAASVYGLRSDGISRAAGGAEADGIRTMTGSLHLGAQATRTLRLEAAYRGHWARTDYDGFPPPAFALADTDEEERSRAHLAMARAALSLFDDRLENTLSVRYHALDRENFDAALPTFAARGERVTADYVGRLALSSHLTLVAGAELERTKIDAGGVVDAVTTHGGFALAIVKPVESLTLTVGGRRDRHQTFGGATTARATAAFAATDALTLRASWGEGFAAPTLFQLNFVCCGGTSPNRDLRPERAEGIDAGFDLRLGERASLGATWFRQETRDLIDFDFGTGAYVNIGAALRRGAEAEFSFDPLPDLSATIAYAFVKATDETTGLDLLRQPRHAVTASLDWLAMARAAFGATLRYNGEAQDGAGPIDAYTRLDLRASWRASDKFEFYGRIENALDADYQSVLGYGEPGVSGFLGVRARL